MTHTARIVIAKPVEHKMSLSEKIRAKAKIRKIVDGKIVLDRNDPQDVEWWSDDEAGKLCR